MKIIRDHDKFYLYENRKQNTKESFKFIVSKVKSHLSKYKTPKVLDIGCATGDFLFYLKSLYPNSNLTGIDILTELLERAKLEVPGAKFIEGNICQKNTLPNQKYDAVFINGVHSIFDDFYPWLDNTLELVDSKNNGKAFIFGAFNPEDVDVLLKVRYSNKNVDSPWQSGWNCFSKKSIQTYLQKYGVKSLAFHDFNIKIDIPRHENDPLRSWTFRYEDGTRGTINGTMLLHNFMLLEITL